MKIFKKNEKSMIVRAAGVVIFGILAFSVAFGARSVNHGFSRAYDKAVVAENVVLHFLKEAAAHMNKRTAFYTFEMEMLDAFRALNILIAESTARVDNEFTQNSLLGKVVEGSVYGGNSNAHSELLKTLYNLFRGNVSTAFLQKIKNSSALLRTVFCLH
jgi:hypothetical protein